MKVIFLGTAAGKPSLHRNTTSIAIELDDSKYILVDCGEATLHQLMRSRLKLSNLHSIYITHLHGDHIYGLPGLICSLNEIRTEPLNIWGPKGLQAFTTIFAQSITNFTLNVYEHDRSVIDVNEFTIAVNQYKIRACRVKHTVECFAYQITKSRFKNKIDKTKLDITIDCYSEQIKKQGFKSPKKIMKHLVEGTTYNFTNPYSGEPFKLDINDFYIKIPEFKLVIALDNYNCTEMIGEFQNANVLIHEATYCILPDMSSSEKESLTQKAKRHGHSTNLMAADTANHLFCKQLILTHFSNRYDFENDRLKMEDEIIQSTHHVFGNKVDLAYDFSEFHLT